MMYPTKCNRHAPEESTLKLKFKLISFLFITHTSVPACVGDYKKKVFYFFLTEFLSLKSTFKNFTLKAIFLFHLEKEIRKSGNTRCVSLHEEKKMFTRVG